MLEFFVITYDLYIHMYNIAYSFINSLALWNKIFNGLSFLYLLPVTYLLR
jgi:hypothetical protein